MKTSTKHYPIKLFAYDAKLFCDVRELSNFANIYIYNITYTYII